MSQPTVLIVGASIAGPTAAYYFARAGFKVTIVERFPALRTNGQNIDIRTAGVTVMRRTPGMEAAVRTASLEMDGMSFSLISEYEIFRGDLAKFLFNLTKDNLDVTYIFDEQIISLSQHTDLDGPVTVTFQNTTPQQTFDLVVACDGATSRTRAMGFECGVRDHITSTNCWTVYFSIPSDLLQGSKISHGYSAPGGKGMGLMTDPKGGVRADFICLSPLSTIDATRPFREALKFGDTALKKYVASQFTGCGWRADEMIKWMWDADDFYGAEILQVKVPSLSKGRFVLVGDAGHAPGFTGGGTSLALAGAYVLAGEICKAKNIQEGLRGYEEKMRPLITELQNVPPLVPTVMAPQTKRGIWIRNWIFAFIAWSGVLAFVEKWFAGAFAHVDKFPLEEYQWVR